MKVTVLTENTACREGVTAQHGLSLFIETEDQKILFDMGQDDIFIHNAKNLGIDLSKVDIAVISHGHYDHGGGLKAFMQVNDTAPIYLHAYAFGHYYNGTEKYIGLDQSLRHNSRLVLTKGSRYLSPKLLLTDCNDLHWDSNPWGLNSREASAFVPDAFLHEQYLEIAEGDKKILISGCSHKGISNIAGHFQPDVLIGGFHLNKLEDAEELKRIADQLRSYRTVYYTGHCTGEKQYAALKAAMGSCLHRLSAGFAFEV